MKFILTTIATVFSIALFAQTFQITLKPGSQLNSFKVVMKPSANLTGGQLSAYQLTISIPGSVTPRPTLGILNNPIAGITPVTTTQTNTVTDGSFYTYQLDAVGTATVPVVNYVGGTEYDMLELVFTGGPPNMAQVRACQFPAGGLLGINNNYLEFNGNDLTNQVAMFYGTTFLNNVLGYAGYSYVALNGIVLPTKFLSFFANKSDDNAKLTWTVDNEEDNSYFEIEASKDARTFNKILKVDALRNGRSSNTYNIVDAQISRYNVSTVYYRIKQVEASGRITYTDVRQVNLDSKNFVAALYPNPVKTVTKLIIEAPEAAKATVIIRDAAGKAVKQLSLQLQKGTNRQNLDLASLAAGDYNLTIVSDKLNQTIKMTKSN